MTLPTLISHYKNEVTVAKLKKAYTTLSQAFQMSESVNGPSEHWEEPYTIGAKTYYEKYWKPYFKNPAQCMTYKECGFPKIMAYTHLNGHAASLDTNTNNTKVIFYLSDGTLYFILTELGTGPMYHIYVDINGSKGPNVMGKDLFDFRYILGKGIVPNGYEASTSELETNCNGKGSGTYCLARIINDGWKIKY